MFAIYVISLVFYIIILKHWVKMGLLCIIFHMYSPFAEYKILALVFKKILTLSFTIHPVGHSSCNIKIFLMIFFWNSIYCIYLIACVDSFILFFWTFLGLYLFIYLFFIFFHLKVLIIKICGPSSRYVLPDHLVVSLLQLSYGLWHLWRWCVCLRTQR